MSLPTYESAIDEMQTLFNAAWVAQAGAIVGGAAPPVVWDGKKSVPLGTVTHARYFLKHFEGGQSSLGGIGSRRWRRSGLITIQLFVPVSKPNCKTLAGKLAKIGRGAYEGVGTATGIWFRRVSLREVGPEDNLYQVNVVAAFEYDEVH